MDTAIDSLQAFDLLKESGMPETQARACVETFQKVVEPQISAAWEEIQEIQKAILNDLVKRNEIPYLKEEFQQELATKSDLFKVSIELDQKIQDGYNGLQHEILVVRNELDQKIQDVHNGLEDKIQGVRNELYQKIQDSHNGLEDKIQSVNNELYQKIQDSHNGLEDKIQSVNNRLEDKIQSVNNRLEDKIQGVRNELKQDIQDVRNELTNELADVKVSLIKWFIGTALAMTSLSLATFALMWEMFLKNGN